MVIVWDATGQPQDAWFQHFWPDAGSTLLVAGTTVGYGPHNHNPNVCYVADGGVLASAPIGAEAAWRSRQEAGVGDAP